MSRGSLLEQAYQRFEGLYISTITYYEIESGARVAGRHSDIKPILPHLGLLNVTRETADASATIYAHLKWINKLVPHNDMLIAGIAHHHQLPLLTLNKKHFVNIKEILSGDDVELLYQQQS